MTSTDPQVKRHYVTFYSPGTFVAETTTKEIDSWDVEQALKRMETISERYGARPYGFRFITRARWEEDLDSREVARSPMHYIGGKVETREEIEERNDPKEATLRSNMRANDYTRVWRSTEGWSWTQPLTDSDIVLSADGEVL